ncbi:dioxygenase family protein [Nocardiopsis ansamitocini]|uniref:Dioxygenase n=1 Tax=Nocardiopsis ansamitocini TaxID=1670832 RepID=A0A9W6P5T2_9ACTN|nr:class III extradiol ring-cleavage dioxygenase [Nocardiopsis ansamitocini]GLU47607.1 dioxygenase [Nocardiopsis ansamitocini]
MTDADPRTGTDRMPVLYFGHGAPPLADDALWTGQLAGWSADLPRPTAVLIVSAHWEAAPVTLGATSTVPLVYDFWGFPRRYYEVTYPAPGAPALAASVRALLGGSAIPVAEDPGRGLDHGAYVPLKQMYPDADVPVLQISMPTLDPRDLFEVGRRLAPLRDEGVLIMGSGFLTHNLSCVDMSQGPGYQPPSWSVEFDDWAGRAAHSGDVDALLDWRVKAPAADIAHPRSEHLAPLFVSLGAGSTTTETASTVIDGFWYGLAKRAFQFG